MNKDQFNILLAIMGVIAVLMNAWTFYELKRLDGLTRHRAALTENVRALYEERALEMEAAAAALRDIIDEQTMVADATAVDANEVKK